MRKRLMFILALMLCASLLCVGAAADSGEVQVGNVTLTSTNPYVTANESGVAQGSEESHNIYWDAASNTLTLNSVNMTISEGTAISADMEQLNIALIGENTITVTHSAPIQSDSIYAAIENESGGITIDGEEGASLKVDLTLTGNTDYVGSEAIAINTGLSFSNNADLYIIVSGTSTIYYDLTGIASGSKLNQNSDTTSGIKFVNSGSIDVDVTNATEYGIGIFPVGTEFENSGSIDVNVTSNSGSVYGIRCIGNFDDLEKSYINNGTQIINVNTQGTTAYGIEIGNTHGTISVTNAECASIEMNVSANASYTSVGINLDSNNDIVLNNFGTIEADVYNPSDSNGIATISYNENAVINNSGILNLTVTTSGDGSAYGIAMFLNYVTGDEVHNTALNFNSGTEASISTGETGDRYAIFQQRYYATSANEGDGENQIYFNGTKLQEDGYISTEYDLSGNYHVYTTLVVGNDENILP